MGNDSTHEKDRTTPEIRLLYQECLDSIRDLKRLQWSVTYYSVLVYAALVSVKVLAVNVAAMTGPLKHTLGLLALFVAVACVGVILNAQSELAKRRRWLGAIWDRYFADIGPDSYDPPKEGYGTMRYNWLRCGLMIVVTLAGAVLVYWVVWLVPATPGPSSE